MVNPNIDEMSMMTYLSQYPNAKLKPGAPLRPRTNPNRWAYSKSIVWTLFWSVIARKYIFLPLSIFFKKAEMLIVFKRERKRERKVYLFKFLIYDNCYIPMRLINLFYFPIAAFPRRGKSRNNHILAYNVCVFCAINVRRLGRSIWDLLTPNHTRNKYSIYIFLEENLKYKLKRKIF